MMKIPYLFRGALLALGLFCGTAVHAADRGAPQAHDRGRYLVVISGCNDCHTPGYPETGGKLAEKQWLVGSPVGFQGPWGVTYPSNLRLSVQEMSEAQWIAKARTVMRPPMPSPSLIAMSDPDLRVIYRYIRKLGGAGSPAPDYVPPGQLVNTPYIEFVPKNLPPIVAGAGS
ncbi:MAG: cytochrome C [Azoarcus sp.]|nr:cytochrome C [Azoarcus sp.]